MKNANHYIDAQNGSAAFYRHKPSGFIFTDGVKTLADTCAAYWLIDLIISHQCHNHVKQEPFQVWDLKRVEDHCFEIICTDGNYNRVTQQLIPFSDFPFDLATLWFVDDCLLLPAEY